MLINKGRLQDTIKVQNVLCVYAFHKFEQEALKLAVYLSHNPELKITILVPKREIYNQNEERNLYESVLPGIDATDAYRDGHDEEKEENSDWTDYLDILFLGALFIKWLRKLFHIKKKERTGEENGNKDTKDTDKSSRPGIEMPLRSR